MKTQNQNTGGFTLIELLVTISIMVIIMSVVLINYHQYNSTFGITNLAYDIALSARTAETYGVAVHANQSDSGPTQFEYGYGLHFDATDPNHYILFADNPTVGQGSTLDYYDGTMACGAGSECVTKYTLQPGYTITGICVTDVDQSQCSPVSGTLDIVFLRPNPDAQICAYTTPSGGGASPSCDLTGDSSSIQKATITLSSSDSSVSQKSIVIQTTGQISVQ